MSLYHPLCQKCQDARLDAQLAEIASRMNDVTDGEKQSDG